MSEKILVVDDDPVQRRLLDAMITKMGHKTVLAEGGSEAIDALTGANQGSFSLIFLDLKMPDMDGMAVLQKMSELNIAIPTIVQTAQGGIETAVDAMRAGAFDFVVKPVSPERVKVSISNALKVGALQTEIKRISKKQSGSLTFADIISSSPAMEKVVRVGERAAASNIPVLIEGESGVGKEMIARAIQGSSERRSKPFVTVNCGALPENLVESILFGHEKGAFTGANEKHIGKFEEADGGTLFLDEVGELPLDVQVKLLRAIQEGEVDRVGGKKPVKTDFRLISATNRTLVDEVKAGHFREDLFYRLNVFPMTIPALRNRKEEIPSLLRHFIARFAAEEGRTNIRTISAEAMDLLVGFDWPGNIRQLENAVFRAVVLCDGDELGIDEFPQIQSQVQGQFIGQTQEPSQTSIGNTGPSSSVSGPVSGSVSGSVSLSVDPAPGLETAMPKGEPVGAAKATSFGISSSPHDQTPDGTNDAASEDRLNLKDEGGELRELAEVERDVIAFALDHYDGKMSKIARHLGIGRSTLYRKLKEYGLEDHGREDEQDSSMIG